MKFVMKVVVAGLAGLSSGVLSGETLTWTNTVSASASASEASNWYQNRAPANGDSAEFNLKLTGAQVNVQTVNGWASDLQLGALIGLPWYQLIFENAVSITRADEFDGVVALSGYNTVATLGAADATETFDRVLVTRRTALAVPSGATTAVSQLTGSAPVRKQGAGHLAIGDAAMEVSRVVLLDGSIGFAAPDGSFELECGVPAGAYLHFDASCADSYDAGTGETTVWRDVRDAQNTATTRKATLGSGSVGNPRIRTAGLNGLNTLGFGAVDGSGSEDLATYGNPSFMTFTRSENIREAFVICRDYQSGKVLFPLGDKNAYDLHRGSSDSGNVGQWLNSQHAKNCVLAGDHRVDGTYREVSQIFPYTDWHLYSYGAVSGGGFSLDRIARDRAIATRMGGLEIAEIVLYTNSLTRAARAQTVDYLMKKWMPAQRLPQGLGSVWMKSGDLKVDVAAGRTAEIPSLELAGSSVEKSGDGTLALARSVPDELLLDIRGGAVSFAGTEVSSSAPAENPVLHLDADDDERMTTSTDEKGRTLVSTWPDTRTDSSLCATRRNSTDAQPFLVLNSADWNGHNYVDFDGYTNAPSSKVLTDDDVTNRYACLKIPAAPNVFEGFLVFRDTSNGGTPFFLGQETAYEFHRQVNRIIANDASENVRSGLWSLDGKTVEPVDTVISRDRPILLSFALPARSSYGIDFLARDRNCRQGGLQYGEVILYNRRLSDTERLQTENYLMKKWFDKASPRASVTKVRSAYVTGDQTEPNLRVGPGATLSVGGQYPAALKDAYLHLDAMDSEAFTTFEQEGKTCVSTWLDTRRNGMVATAGTDVPWRPTLDEWTGAGGTRPIVDLGDISDGNQKPTGDMTGSYFWFPRANKTVKEVFVVFGDNSSASANHYNFVISDCEGETASWKTYDFHRNVMNGGLLGTDALADLRDSTKTRITYDGADATYNQVVGSGMHVISFSLTNSSNCASAGSLGNDRGNCRWGGVRYGEVIILTNVLTSAERESVVSYLNAKWHGTTSLPKQAYGLEGGTIRLGPSFAALPAGSTLDFTYDPATAGFGTIEASATYSLPATATVRFHLPDGVNLPSGTYPIVRATALEGSCANWTVATTGIPARKLAGLRLVQSGDTVSVRVTPRGLVMFVCGETKEN